MTELMQLSSLPPISDTEVEVQGCAQDVERGTNFHVRQNRERVPPASPAALLQLGPALPAPLGLGHQWTAAGAAPLPCWTDALACILADRPPP